jgi:hypothetical protein
MAEISWLLHHPMSDKELRDYWARQMRKAVKGRNKAQEEGNEGAYAAWDDLYNYAKSKMDAIDALTATVHVDWAVNNLKNIPVLGGILGSITGRAAGGPVKRGMPYLGENRRPEVFVPESDGHIDPNVGGMSGRLEIVVRDPDGGLARAGISTTALAGEIATATQARRRWRS